MYCLDCRYNLLYLSTNTCPECGSAFDPSDNSTFASQQNRRLITLPPRESIASIACSVIYYAILFIDSQPSARRGIDRWYYHGGKFIAFIIFFAISIGLLLAVIRLKRWIATSLGLLAAILMAWQIVQWIDRFLPYWF